MFGYFWFDWIFFLLVVSALVAVIAVIFIAVTLGNIHTQLKLANDIHVQLLQQKGNSQDDKEIPKNE